jgi:hypothetical protein
MAVVRRDESASRQLSREGRDAFFPFSHHLHFRSLFPDWEADVHILTRRFDTRAMLLQSEMARNGTERRRTS